MCFNVTFSTSTTVDFKSVDMLNVFIVYVLTRTFVNSLKSVTSNLVKVKTFHMAIISLSDSG